MRTATHKQWQTDRQTDRQSKRHTEKERQYGQKQTYVKVSVVHKQVMQADAKAAGICSRCYNNDRPIRTIIHQLSDGTGKHCRDPGIYAQTNLST